jgi:hypothetical protein
LHHGAGVTSVNVISGVADAGAGRVAEGIADAMYVALHEYQFGDLIATLLHNLCKVEGAKE